MIDRNATLAPHIDPGSSFKLIGLGGIGGIVARYLALFLAAQRTPVRLVLIDGDSFEPANAERMAFDRPDKKAVVAQSISYS